MATRFVGPGGSDTADGTTWVKRKLTLNGVEDIPVTAADIIYVGPGIYRENLTLDVDGTSGNIITYIGDVTGENTDDVGGVVRITGSDNDQTKVRADGVSASSIDFRTFRGFRVDLCTTTAFDLDDCTEFIIEDCVLAGIASGEAAIGSAGASQSNITIRRCVFVENRGQNIRFEHSSTVNDAGHLVENCILYSGANDMLNVQRVGGITVKNSFFIGAIDDAIDVQIALAASQTVTVNNCIFVGCEVALEATVTGEIVEDFNAFFSNATNRQNTATGSNSNTFPPLFSIPPLFDGLVMPEVLLGTLSEYSPLGRIAGTGEATDDLFGVARPTTSAKKSWGAVQLREAERDTGTKSAGSASLKLADAGDHQIFVPTTNASTTFAVKVNREASYAGTNPQIIVRQPGASDSTDTDTGSTGSFNDISVTVTPNANPPYVVVILRSLNTSVTGSFATYFDVLDVS